jgi:uncharacterized OB-fold protein
MSGIADWTSGAEALAYERCGACGTIRYFRRTFCANCGSPAVESRLASGRGTVYAITTVTRAPSAELRAYAPYRIALVDAEEGFRFMTHAAEGLTIGDAVSTRFRSFGERIVPFVEPERS